MFTFPKSARLLRAEEFTSVFRAPEINLSSGPLRIRARRNRMPSARMGLVVSKKGTPKAHRRNRVKRVIRETFRLHRHELPAVDIVIQVFGDIEDKRLPILLQQQFDRISRELSD